MVWTGQEYERCVSKHDITNAVIKRINFRLVDSIVVEDDEVAAGLFYLHIRLRWWTWIGLGFIHQYYHRKLQRIVDERAIVSVRGIVRVR